MEPDSDRCNVDCALVHPFSFVIPCRYGTVLFELVEAPLDGIAVLVALGIEGRWASAGRSFLAPVGLLVLLDRDHPLDPPPPQVVPVASGGIRLVRQHPGRTGPWPPRIPSLNAQGLKQRNKPGRVTVLTGARQSRERAATSISEQMNLRCPSSSGSA